MSRNSELKRLNIRSRNQLRAILFSADADIYSRLNAFRGSLGKTQLSFFEEIVASPAAIRVARPRHPFPKKPPFGELLTSAKVHSLPKLLDAFESLAASKERMLLAQIDSLDRIDVLLAQTEYENAANEIDDHIHKFGWSHAALRKLVLSRERTRDEHETIENLLWAAGLHNSSLVVTSIIHCFAEE